MIYLITGAPGMGKTAHALTLMRSMPQYPDKVVIIGVREYKGKGEYYESLPEGFDFAKYPGYLFLIDEAQDYWPSRVAGYKAPASLDFLPKHRHIGQDFILTCQFPTQLDVKLRQIVGRHIHLKAEALGVFTYESGTCEDKLDFDPNSKRPRGAIPKETQEIYVSMEGEETQLQKSRPKLPFKLWLVLGVVVLAFGFAAAMLFGTDNILKGLATGESPAQQTDADQKFDPLAALQQKKGEASGRSPKSEEIKPLRLIRHYAELQPGNTDYPELAQQPRIPASCIANKTRCICYDQAMQVIAGMSEKRCRSLVGGQDSLVVAWARDDTPRLELYSKPPMVNLGPIQEAKKEDPESPFLIDGVNNLMPIEAQKPPEAR